jgi:hypothetical protein
MIGRSLKAQRHRSAVSSVEWWHELYGTYRLNNGLRDASFRAPYFRDGIPRRPFARDVPSACESAKLA